MTAPSVGAAIALPLRSAALLIPESLRTITWVVGLLLTSIASPALATTSRPPWTALRRSVGVEAANSNCRPTVPGRSDRFWICVRVTSRPCLAKMPLSSATQAGSQVATGT
jgi:hypothetical protein